MHCGGKLGGIWQFFQTPLEYRVGLLKGVDEPSEVLLDVDRTSLCLGARCDYSRALCDRMETFGELLQAVMLFYRTYKATNDDQSWCHHAQ